MQLEVGYIVLSTESWERKIATGALLKAMKDLRGRDVNAITAAHWILSRAGTFELSCDAAGYEADTVVSRVVEIAAELGPDSVPARVVEALTWMCDRSRCPASRPVANDALKNLEPRTREEAVRMVEAVAAPGPHTPGQVVYVTRAAMHVCDFAQWHNWCYGVWDQWAKNKLGRYG